MTEEKEAYNSWNCIFCTMKNNQHISYCEACLKPRDDDGKKSVNTVNTEMKENRKSDKNWKCKLCSMKNNKYIPRCEMCLVPRNIQKNGKLFNELQATLNSNLCDKHIKADEIIKMVERLKNDFQRLTMYHSDKQIIPEIQQQIDTIYAKMNLKCDGNMVQDFIETYNMDHAAFKKQRKSNKKCHPICKCGAEMISIKSNKCYGSEYKYVVCDICDKQIPPNDKVFNCPQKKVDSIHSNGFDLCLKCRKKYIHRLRYFVAIIICPTMSENHIGRDAETLKTMFTKLGFHKVICLKGDEVNKERVENALNRMLPKNKENVNQLTAICYSGHGHLDNDDKYWFAIDPYDRKTWISSDIIKKQCGAATYGAAIDGFKKYFNQFWYKTYYRHNTLLLVNSCHSGGLYDFVDSQIIADSFGTTTALTILLSAFGLTPSVLAAATLKLGSFLNKTAIQCVRGCFQGEIAMECIAACFGITEEALLIISISVGIAVIVVIIITIAIYKAIQKSKECESIYVIASCYKKEESNTCFGVSPFIKHCNEFFHLFLNPKKQKNIKLENGYILNKENLMDSPLQLFKYLEASYNKIKHENLGGTTLNIIGQTVCSSKRGFNQFAICPMLNTN